MLYNVVNFLLDSIVNQTHIYLHPPLPWISLPLRSPQSIKQSSLCYTVCSPCCSVAQSCLTLCDPMDCSMPGFPCPSLSPGVCSKLMSIELVMPSNRLILCHPLLLLPSIFPSIRVFSNESALRIKWTKYWSFNFNISHSNEYSGLISFRIESFDLFAVQGTVKSLLQHHRSKVLILQHSAFFMVQLSHQ